MVNESHKNMIEGLLKMSDDQLVRWTLSSDIPDGLIAQYGRLVFDMRCAIENRKAATDMVIATARMVKATWAIALITLATQVALIVMMLER